MDIVITAGAIILGTGIWLWVLRRYDRIEPEAVRNLVFVALVGGTASVLVAALLNESIRYLIGLQTDVFQETEVTEIGRLLAFSLFVGFNEEICKAVAAVYTTRFFGDFDEPVDAMIYAMTVGLGFAAVENVLYATRFGNDVLLVRFLWPVPAHMAYASIWGFGLAKARFMHPGENKARVMWVSVAGAGLIHAMANFLLFVQSTEAALVSLIVLGILAYLAHQRLNSLIAESPFLDPGECPVCRNLNSPLARECVHCGAPLQNTQMFRNCPCGRARISIFDSKCPVCGITLEHERPEVSKIEHPGSKVTGRESKGAGRKSNRTSR